ENGAEPNPITMQLNAENFEDFKKITLRDALNEKLGNELTLERFSDFVRRSNEQNNENNLALLKFISNALWKKLTSEQDEFSPSAFMLKLDYEKKRPSLWEKITHQNPHYVAPELARIATDPLIQQTANML